MAAQEQVLFQEVQHFRQPLLWIVIGGASLLLLGVFGYGMVQQLVLGRPWGNVGIPNPTLAIVGGLSVAFGILLPLLFFFAGLTTEVREDGLYVKFFPIHWSFQRIPLEGLQSHEPRTYRPIAEYGGWGIRYGSSGRAYNIQGDRGVQLVYEDGSRLLIGSQRPEELDEAIGRVVPR